jgi:hypothetical protein
LIRRNGGVDRGAPLAGEAGLKLLAAAHLKIRVTAFRL